MNKIESIVEKSFRKFLEREGTLQALEDLALDIVETLKLNRLIIIKGKRESGCRVILVSDTVISQELPYGSEECRWLDLEAPRLEDDFMALPVKCGAAIFVEGLPTELDKSEILSALRYLEMALCIHINFVEPLQLLKIQLTEAKKAHITSLSHISKMTHDLKTPLATIIASVELLLAGTLGEINDKQRRYLEIIKENSYQLHVMLDDLLDLSRLQLGKVKLEITTFSLKKAIDEVIKLFEGQILDKGLNLSVDFKLTNEYITADKRRIKQVIYNLLSNSVKFTPSGGSISIIVESEDTENVKVTVQDTGPGFSDKYKGDIFKEIESRWTNLQGMSSSGLPGLGLMVIKKFVELQGGRVWAESPPEGGSKFMFSIPRTAHLKTKENAA